MGSHEHAGPIAVPSGDSDDPLGALAAMVKLCSSEPESATTEFPPFEEWVQTMLGGWGSAATCDRCGDAADRATAWRPFCFPCARLEYGVEYGKYSALVELGRHLHQGFAPVLDWCAPHEP
jgi:hypothetical protein